MENIKVREKGLRIQGENQSNLFYSHEELKKYILYYNIVFPFDGMFAADYTLMPNACSTLSIAFDGAKVTAELWGASITPTVLGAEPNRYDILLLVQLSPYGLYQITKLNQNELADKRIPLQDIDRGLSHGLSHAFTAAETVADIVNACDEVLLRRMEQVIVSDGLLLAAEVISNRQGQICVKDIAAEAGYSQRHLNRLFLTQIGINVKSYARLMRFNHVLKHVDRSLHPLIYISQEAGYYDQAHFDKDFKDISGVTPLIYTQKMSDFYYDGAEILAKLSLKER